MLVVDLGEGGDRLLALLLVGGLQPADLPRDLILDRLVELLLFLEGEVEVALLGGHPAALVPHESLGFVGLVLAEPLAVDLLEAGPGPRFLVVAVEGDDFLELGHGLFRQLLLEAPAGELEVSVEVLVLERAGAVLVELLDRLFGRDLADHAFGVDGRAVGLDDLDGVAEILNLALDDRAAAEFDLIRPEGGREQEKSEDSHGLPPS